MYYLKNKKEMLGFSSLRSYPNIFHFTTTRNGGVSKNSYAFLNGSYFSGDSENNVDKNWEKILSYSEEQPRYIACPYQIHSDTICVIDNDFFFLSPDDQEDALHGVDALITKEENVLITVATADCVPVTLFDPKAEVIAVVHAGWRGTVKNIIGKTIKTLIKEFNSNPQDLVCCIGPSISLMAFEVGNEVVDLFSSQGFMMEEIAFFNRETQKYHIDLWKANSILLEEAGVLSENISCSGICTYSEYHHFFSARRLGIKSGRMITGIMLKKNNYEI